MSPEKKYLSPYDIERIIPFNLIMHMIKGIMSEFGLTIGVMLDVDEDNFQLSRGTGKIWISDDSISGQSLYCSMLRRWPDELINKRCGICDRIHFDSIKEKVVSNPDYSGEIYRCSSGGLWDFAVPIVEGEAHTFIGVIFGGQKRSRQTFIEAGYYLINYRSKPENIALKLIPFFTHYLNYLKAGQVTTVELEMLKTKCMNIADELSEPCAFFVQIQRERFAKEMEHKAFENIEVILDSAKTSEELLKIMGRTLYELENTLLFDWGITLIRKSTSNETDTFEVSEVTGKGIGPHDKVRNMNLSFSQKDIIQITEPSHNPSFSNYFIHSLVSGEPDWWWLPIKMRDGPILGAIVFGSSPMHRNTKYNFDYIQQRMHIADGIIGRITTKFTELYALEREKQSISELQKSEDRLKQNISLLEETLLGLMHQSKRPLIMVQAALSNVRDLQGKISKENLDKNIELAILAAKHAELMNRGILRIFAVELGSKFEKKIETIDVKVKLDELCQTMREMSGRKDVNFSFFQNSPMINMDLDSFLYVFYVLIDNAIKYSYSGRVIVLVCDEERSIGEYAIKIKSVGAPILDSSIVFRKFGRGKDAYKYDETGIGLGCWSAREHMRKLGGDLTLETDGNLSVFIVHIPPQSISGD